MATLIFTQQLARFLAVPSVVTDARTLRAALEIAFAANPALKSYVVDEQWHLRKHVVIFIDSERLRDRRNLDVPLGADSTAHILQALSGG